MKRKRTESLVAKWKQVFSKGKVKPAGAGNTPQQGGSGPKGPSLTLVKKVPVTFRLARLESPGDFELMSFVAKACAKTANEPFKTLLHVEQTRTGSRLIATDGHRMHMAVIPIKIKSGNYRPRVTKDVITLGEPVEGVKYPSWSKAIPEAAVKRGVINLERSGLGRDRKETEKLSVALNAFTGQTGETVNLRFLEDLTKREWEVYSRNEKRKAVLLRQKTGKAEPDANGPVAVIVPIALAA
jgi:hypothetical protein